MESPTAKRKKSKSKGGEVVEAQLILKRGGELTTLGRAQSKKVGEEYRCTMYPGVFSTLAIYRDQGQGNLCRFDTNLKGLFLPK